MKRINGFIFEGENEHGSYTMTVAVENGRIMVENESHLGHTVVFNEPIGKFNSIADLCDELHEQGLEDIEQAISGKIGNDVHSIIRDGEKLYQVFCPLCGTEFMMDASMIDKYGTNPADWTWQGNIDALREHFDHDCDAN
jgi:hypothetical protein